MYHVFAAAISTSAESRLTELCRVMSSWQDFSFPRSSIALTSRTNARVSRRDIHRRTFRSHGVAAEVTCCSTPPVVTNVFRSDLVCRALRIPQAANEAKPIVKRRYCHRWCVRDYCMRELFFFQYDLFLLSFNAEGQSPFCCVSVFSLLVFML